MATSRELLLSQSTMVEVSGWDENQIFFVERTDLAWDEFAGKHITLTHMLGEGSIIFVRPIQTTGYHRPNPIPYEAEFVGCTPEGHPQFRLTGVQPRNCLRKEAIH